MGEPKSRKPDPAEAEIRDWWKTLTEPAKPGQASRRGELAEIRRCKTLAEIHFAAPYQHLFQRVAARGWPDRICVAAIAGLLAHVKQDTAAATNEESESKAEKAALKPSRRTVAALFAEPSKPGAGPRVSELRFQRLVANETVENLYPMLLRVIHLAGNTVPVPDLIQSIRYWGDKKRRDWTFRYYEQLLEAENKKPSSGD